MLFPADLRADDLRPLPQRLAIVSMLLGWGALVLGVLPWSDRERYQTHRPELAGSLAVVGSRATAEPVARWVAIFRREHPAVHVTTAFYGTAVATAAVADGTADIAPLVRSLPNVRQARPLPVFRIGTLRGMNLNDRSLDIYVAPVSCAQNRLAAIEFVEVALSREGQRQITDRRYVPAKGRCDVKNTLRRLDDSCRT